MLFPPLLEPSMEHLRGPLESVAGDQLWGCRSWLSIWSCPKMLATPKWLVYNGHPIFMIFTIHLWWCLGIMNPLEVSWHRPSSTSYHPLGIFHDSSTIQLGHIRLARLGLLYWWSYWSSTDHHFLGVLWKCDIYSLHLVNMINVAKRI